MAFGSAVLLFVLGAILAFGVTVEAEGIDLNTIGYILMAAGAVGGVVSLMMTASHRAPRNMSSTREVHPTADGGTVVHTEHQT